MNNASPRRQLGITFGNAICYSGYRQGQSPLDDIYPSYTEVSEDLRILARHWQYLRLYDCSRHADLVLDVIRKLGLDFKVMLGVDLEAETQSPDCPWIDPHPQQQLDANRRANDAQVDRLIELANSYRDIVFSVSVGNEATVGWSDRRVPLERLLEFVHRIRSTVTQPVTFCENYLPWKEQIRPLANELDFISLHSYPVWEYRTITKALAYTQQNYLEVVACYPDKPVVVTEAGWTTRANGQGIDAWNASQALQARYYHELMQWSRHERILTFVFEAFDEPWKGSPDPDEPEKHWGLFTVDRKPKHVMQELYAHLLNDSSRSFGNGGGAGRWSGATS